MNTREMVLDVLLALERGEGLSHVLIRSVLDKYDYLPVQDKAFFKRLAEGSIERQLELDYCLERFSSVPVRKMKPLIHCLMRLSVYQILYMDGVPDSAACNEAVKLAAKRGFQNLKGFVNGVLRALSRGKETLVYPDPVQEPKRYLSIRYSMPETLIDPWLAEYGFSGTEEILRGLQEIHPVSIRFRSQLDREKRQVYLDRMEEMGVIVKPSPYLENAYLLERVEGVHSLPGYADGAFAVQDVSSILAVEAAGIGPEDFVIDVCAAPGGKALYAAEKAKRVLARDLGPGKMEMMEENRSRLRAENVVLQEWDAARPDQTLFETADVVLMDVPCSGLGVIGRKRDIKYRVDSREFDELGKLQRAIVAGCWEYVKPGGVLLYSTCTIRREENEEMCGFICSHYPFALESMEAYLPETLSDRARQGFLQLLPKDACDGFFLARLRRKEDSK